ncbi:class I SAM-dependent methyltransferase [Sulfolobus acidocaldarius]|uniref:Methyltransferase n=4 Tax=Sulfolobus acidocaldarius TaxID=2285 RepID=Q4J808_SULAC|nr:class I SAM-dependent methyltransferase [Sulfolobus acidocaldarius]AAY81074.1 methyltransferase [Sulfolobus acidocaldarius DSM 639]AGE71681.1 methyltransferase [Sulfolobus acidocaldarius N8]AGE73954.1 methyltransferase [Sulfolobus acidocaldarius Ron12/I]ALU30108.1 methyltransferase [Sulfolobus acidocaldarius]ALU30801.1 methyltransferase [Sulfolobus acidocaldarius]
MKNVEDRKISPFILSLPLRRLIESEDDFIDYVKPGMVVLDHGCGPGYYTFSLARKVGNKGLVYALDSDERQIRILSSKLEREGITNVKTFVSRDLSPIPSNSIDFVLSKDVLCCTVLHKELADEIKRVLKPGGLAFVSIRKGFGPDPRNISAKELFSLFPDSVKRYQGLLSAWVLYKK